MGRKVIVLITDGIDQGSKLKIEEAIEASQKSDVVIYSIDYADPSAYGPFLVRRASAILRCRECPARPAAACSKWTRKHTLDDAFKELQDEMRSQYSIAYTSTNPEKDGSLPQADRKGGGQESESAGAQRVLRDQARAELSSLLARREV